MARCLTCLISPSDRYTLNCFTSSSLTASMLANYDAISQTGNTLAVEQAWGKVEPMEPAPGLPIDPVEQLRQRRSAKWQTYPRDVLPLPVAEMDVNLAR